MSKRYTSLFYFIADDVRVPLGLLKSVLPSSYSSEISADISFPKPVVWVYCTSEDDRDRSDSTVFANLFIVECLY